MPRGSERPPSKRTRSMKSPKKKRASRILEGIDRELRALERFQKEFRKRIHKFELDKGSAA